MITDQYLIPRNHRSQEDERNNLELFKNLLQPHFLFNSLNNLYALSLRKSEDTPEAIAGLSLLLERVVTYSRQETILLSEEIELIQEIAQKWCQHNTESIVEFTHEQLPWKISRDNEVIPYELITQEEPENVY